MLPGVSIDVLMSALHILIKRFPTFCIKPLWNCQDNLLIETHPSTVEEIFSLFLQDKAKIIIEYEPFLKCDCLRITIDKKSNKDANIEIVWWSDIAIPFDVNIKERAILLIKHFLWLQTIFKCPEVLMAPSTSLPYNNEIWVRL